MTDRNCCQDALRSSLNAAQQECIDLNKRLSESEALLKVLLSVLTWESSALDQVKTEALVRTGADLQSAQSELRATEKEMVRVWIDLALLNVCRLRDRLLSVSSTRS